MMTQISPLKSNIIIIQDRNGLIFALIQTAQRLVLTAKGLGEGMVGDTGFEPVTSTGCL